MKLSNIKLFNYKNYESAELVFDTRIVAITGRNGVGKTNILDAIYYLCLGKSYFTSLDKNVVRYEADFFRLEADFSSGINNIKLVVKVKPSSVKEIEVNGVKVTKLTEHIGLIPIVIVSPYDVHTLLHGNEERRIFVNNTIVQYDKIYLEHLSLYNRLLKQRNSVLKDYIDRKYFDKDYLMVLSQQMENSAMYIYNARKLFIEQLQSSFKNYYSRISNDLENCKITYMSGLDHNDFMSGTTENLDKDRILGRTSFGIHKDEIVFLLNGHPLKEFGSQGQLKSFIFALKFSQHDILALLTGKKPILLLDDIFDKLDPHRINHLMKIISGQSFEQVFITDTHAERISEIVSEVSPESISEIKL